MAGTRPVLLIALCLIKTAVPVAAQNARSAPSSAPLDQAAFDGLADYIEKARQQWQVPGLSVAIVKDDRVVMAKGFGTREVGKPAKVDERTIFALSSMGKAFAAAAAAVLVDQGKLGWDDLIVDHLPWFQMPDAWVTRQVTVRDLLAHRAGLGDETWGATRVSREEVARRVRYMTPVSSFRSSYNYTNVGITTAGLAAAAAAGVDWLTLMETRVLRPLKMDSSTTSLSSLWKTGDIAPCYQCVLDHPVGIEQSLHKNIVMPHIFEAGKVRVIPWRTVDNIAPAGSINSNAVDMAQWLRMQLGKGMYDGHRFLSAAAVAEMHTPQIVIRPDALPIGPSLAEAEDRFHFWAYGLGWRMNDYRGRKMVWHTGGITGFYSIMALLPDVNLGVAVLTNGWRSAPALLVYAITLRVFDAYLGGAGKDWSTDLLAKSDEAARQQEEAERRVEASRVRGTSPSLPLEAYAGRYTHPAHDTLVVATQGDQLALRFPSTLSGTLEHWSYDTFRVRWNSATRGLSQATFLLDPQHRLVGLRLPGYGEFRRVVNRD